MLNAIVNVNGQISSAQSARVAVFDRGYLYGDSLYEVAKTRKGKLIHLDAHMSRLYKSAELCRMTLDQTPEVYAREMARTVDAYLKEPGNAQKEVYCRLIVSRGEGKIGFGLSCLLSPTRWTIIAQELEPPTASAIEKGMSLQVSDRLRNAPRALDPAMKSGNYLNNLLAYLEAGSRGFDDALLCDKDGFVTEGTTYNIFYVKNKIVVTPPIDIGILEGITRRHALEAARALGFPTREVRFPRERLYEADEVFVTSTIREVFPVTWIDGRKIRNGRPGPTTLQLRARITGSAT